MIVLHPYVEGYRETDQADTWRLLAESPFPVRHIPVRRGDTVWVGEFRQAWGTDSLVIVEHDVAADRSRISEIGDCGYSHCTVPYHIEEQPFTPGVLWSIGNQTDTPVREGQHSAFRTGFGLVKIALDVQKWDLPHYLTWQTLDAVISKEISRRHGPWHVHWPEVRHNHIIKGGISESPSFSPHPAR